MVMAFSIVSFMERAWSSIFLGHFTNNVMGYGRYLVVVTKAYGVYIPDSEERSRRRHEAIVNLAQEAQGAEDAVKYLKRNLRKRQRKETLTTMVQNSYLECMDEAIQAEEEEMEEGHDAK